MMTVGGIWFRTIPGFVLLAVRTLAQAPPGAASVTGTVLDRREAPIAGAKVVLTDRGKRIKLLW